MSDFWQYGVGALAVAVVGAAVKLLNGKRHHEATTETLNYEQMKYLLEQSRIEMTALRAENAQLRGEVMNLREDISNLNATIQILQSSKG